MKTRACFKCFVNNCGSDNVSIANIEEASHAVFTVAFCCAHAKYNLV